jgi:hypothetical protein
MIKCALHRVLRFPNYILTVLGLAYTANNAEPAHVVHTCQLNIEQCCWAWIGCNNIVQYCWQLWTMWAAKHCSILFSSILQQPERFYACRLFYLYSNCDISFLINCVYPNPPCQLSLWEETWAPGETHDFRWLTLFTWVRSENQTHVLRGERRMLRHDCATECPTDYLTPH